MTPNAFNELLIRDPFIPLRLHLNSGEVVEITDPGCAFIQGTTVLLFTMKHQGSRMIDNNRYIPLRNVAQVEQAAA
ncbi:MAG: hypothetical protein WD042_18525 [Phycisphaeraceae bacterium]